jgi:hypothetical protein
MPLVPQRLHPSRSLAHSVHCRYLLGLIVEGLEGSDRGGSRA